MFGINTRIIWHKPFKSDLDNELVELYRYFLGKVRAPVRIRESILDPGTLIIEVIESSLRAESFILRPAVELEAAKKRRRDSQWRMEQIARKKPLTTPK